MKKKRVGYGNFYCWNCGRRIIKGKRNCPYCHVPYGGRNRYSHPELLLPAEPGIHHRSFRKYKWRSLACYLTWMAGISVLLPLVIWLGDRGETSFEYIFSDVIWGVLAILWTFWLVWIFFQMRGRKKHLKAVQQQNRRSAGEVVCASCGNSCDRRDNYCGRCGCILLK